MGQSANFDSQTVDTTHDFEVVLLAVAPVLDVVCLRFLVSASRDAIMQRVVLFRFSLGVLLSGFSLSLLVAWRVDFLFSARPPSSGFFQFLIGR